MGKIKQWSASASYLYKNAYAKGKYPDETVDPLTLLSGVQSGLWCLRATDICSREATLFPIISPTSENGVNYSRKEFAPCGSKHFSLRVDQEK